MEVVGRQFPCFFVSDSYWYLILLGAGGGGSAAYGELPRPKSVGDGITEGSQFRPQKVVLSTISAYLLNLR